MRHEKEMAIQIFHVIKLLIFTYQIFCLCSIFFFDFYNLLTAFFVCEVVAHSSYHLVKPANKFYL